MGKRKSEDKEERIRRKIKKLNDKLKKRQRIIYSSSDEDSNHTSAENGDPPPLPPPPSDDEEIPLNPDPETVPEETPSVADLDNDILALLGEAPEPETELGKAIHKDVAARWLDIIKKGLNKEAREKLAKDYLIPSNCELLVPPLLNPEAKAALTDPFVKRDSSLMYRQKQISNALAALAPAVEVIISKDCDQSLKQKLLKPVSDACRILCDMHHNETKIRKKFVISSISTGLKDTLISSSTDKYLFGDNMSEKIKNAKNVQRSGEALKVPAKVQKPNFPKNYGNKTRTNFKPLHQKTVGKVDAGKNPSTSRQQNNRAPYRRAPAERSPPPSPRRRTTRR